MSLMALGSDLIAVQWQTCHIRSVFMGNVKMQKKARPFVGLDVLRCCAALGVMFYHYFYLISVPHHTTFRVSGGGVAFPEIADVAKYGYLGVEVFFVISGFVISLSASAATPLKFALGRIYRLFPSVLICAPLTFFVALAVQDGSLLSLLQRLIRSLFFIPVGQQIDGVYWTLGIELAFYAVVFAALFTGMWRNFSIILYAITCISLTYVLLNIIVGYGSWMGGRIGEIMLLKHGCFFAAGSLIYIVGTEKPSSVTYLFMVLSLCGAFLEIINTFAKYNVSGQIIACLVFATAVLLLFAAIKYNENICEIFKKQLNGFREIGRATYPLYLLHQLIGAAIIGLLARQGFNNYASVIFATLAIFALVALVMKVELSLSLSFRRFVEQRVAIVWERLAAK